MTKYPDDPRKNHPFLEAVAGGTRAEGRCGNAHEKPRKSLRVCCSATIAEKKRIDDENHIRLGLNPSREDLSKANLVSMDRETYVLWEDFFGGGREPLNH